VLRRDFHQGLTSICGVRGLADLVRAHHLEVDTLPHEKHDTADRSHKSSAELMMLKMRSKKKYCHRCHRRDRGQIRQRSSNELKIRMPE
jgi:hypothetical protein